MSAMSMPGFTAEVSLYKTMNHYHMIGAIHEADGTVHAAQISLGNPPCFVQCFQECIQEGIPPFQCGPACRRQCNPPGPTCGPCVGVRQCSDGSQRSCTVS